MNGCLSLAESKPGVDEQALNPKIKVINNNMLRLDFDPFMVITSLSISQKVRLIFCLVLAPIATQFGLSLWPKGKFIFEILLKGSGNHRVNYLF